MEREQEGTCILCGGSSKDMTLSSAGWVHDETIACVREQRDSLREALTEIARRGDGADHARANWLTARSALSPESNPEGQ